MECIRFELSGQHACFRKPDVNVHAYFTYNNIHKVALLGVLGSILGLGGYTQLFNKSTDEQEKPLGQTDEKYDDGFPEFYQRLKDFKVSIVPKSQYGYFSKKIQTFNNSVGYASQETGGNLVVREQWLENPSWEIWILSNESDDYKLLKQYLQESKTKFIPYLGKNDHFANIKNVEVLQLEKASAKDKYMDSLFFSKDIDKDFGYERDGEMPFFFLEFSPVALEKHNHMYVLEELVFTNFSVETFPQNTYSYEQKNYFFL